MNLRLLQIITFLISLATIGLGGMQLITGLHNPLYDSGGLAILPVLDNNLRFFGGLGLGLGLILLWTVLDLEKRGNLFRAVWICAGLGGIGRLVSIVILGVPSSFMLLLTIFEIVGAPLFILWHSRLSKTV